MAEGDPDVAGAVWTLSPREGDLDSNIIRLRAGTGIEAHTGPDLDVLIVVLAGTGRVVTETDPLELRPGTLVWFPRRSRREFAAGPGGLHYLTVHHRRDALVLEPPPGRPPTDKDADATDRLRQCLTDIDRAVSMARRMRVGSAQGVEWPELGRLLPGGNLLGQQATGDRAQGEPPHAVTTRDVDPR